MDIFLYDRPEPADVSMKKEESSMRKDLWKLAVPAAALLLALSGCSGQKAPEETAASAEETEETVLGLRF